MDGIMDDPVVKEITERLRQRLGDRLKEMWLFGSRARGSYTRDADYDVLVVADGNRTEITDIVSEEEDRLLLEYEQLINGLVYDSESWKVGSNSPLGWNIQKEGLRLV